MSNNKQAVCIAKGQLTVCN